MTRKSIFPPNIGYSLLFIVPILVILAFIGLVFIKLIWEGLPTLSLSFVTENPKESGSAGGIFPMIIGTVFVTFITFIFAAPLGICAAIYLSEYTQPSKLTRIIRISIRNLSGVPSIVYGLFGLAIFVGTMGAGRSVLASGLTLGLLTLPWIIVSAEEALKAVPNSYREGGLALGASKWQTIFHNVIPTATPGIITGVILGISRAAGETAPILFTGVAFYTTALPSSVFDQFMALPYHLYMLTEQHEGGASLHDQQYGTAVTLFLLIILLNIIPVLYRSYLRLMRRRSN